MDWNQDGTLDILSGCYWTQDYNAAHIQMLAGEPEQSFAAAVDLVDVNGEPLVNQAAQQDAEAADDEAKQPQEPNFNNICTQQHAVDYDGDGDLDLVVGNISDQFFVHFNDAGPDAAAEFSGQATKLELSVPGGHSSPHLVDWDGDGDLDLLSGSSEGGVFFAENTGSREAPEWASFKQLIATLSGWDQTTDGDREIEPGRATRVWATDWNGDGLLDLLVGDMVKIVNRRTDISEADAAAAKAKYEQLNEEIQAKSLANSKAMEALDGAEPSEELLAKIQEVSDAFRKSREIRAKFVDETITGHVWLYLRTTEDSNSRTASSAPGWSR